MGRARRRGPAFRSWGVVLAIVAALVAIRGEWLQVSLVTAVWIGYLLLVRLVPCRVQTLRQRPCRWRVRGTLSTCDYHLGLKRGLPVLYPTGTFSLPMFMWTRTDLARQGPEPQPSGADQDSTTAPNARDPRREWLLSFLAVAGVVIALASFIRDVLAG